MAPCNIFSCAKLMTKSLPQGAWGSKNKEWQKRQKCRTPWVGGNFQWNKFSEGFLWFVAKEELKIHIACLWTALTTSYALAWERTPTFESLDFSGISDLYFYNCIFFYILYMIYLNTIKSVYPKLNSLSLCFLVL